MKKILALALGLFLIGTDAYAGNGDLIVNGVAGIGTTTPTGKLNAIPIGNLNSGTAPNFSQAGLVVGSSSSGMAFDANQIESSGDVLYLNYNSGYGIVLAKGGGNVAIGTTNPGSYKLYVNGVTYSYGGYQPSDSKFKKDVLPIDSALDKVQKLAGVSYLYKTDEYKDKGFPEGKQLGVIAQELEKVIPEAVMTDEEGSKAVNYSEIIPVLIEAIKEQQNKIAELESTVTQLKYKLK